MIVPVHMLGRHGALLSDTIDGMLWADNINMFGMPANASSARAVNVSLDNVGRCSAIEQDVVNQPVVRDAIAVVATNNEAARIVDTPTDRSGAVAITAHIDSGENVSYANVGL